MDKKCKGKDRRKEKRKGGRPIDQYKREKIYLTWAMATDKLSTVFSTSTVLVPFVLLA